MWSLSFQREHDDHDDHDDCDDYDDHDEIADHESIAALKPEFHCGSRWRMLGGTPPLSSQVQPSIKRMSWCIFLFTNIIQYYLGNILWTRVLIQFMVWLDNPHLIVPSLFDHLVVLKNWGSLLVAVCSRGFFGLCCRTFCLICGNWFSEQCHCRYRNAQKEAFA